MPVKELRGFARVELQPGESREVSVVLGGRDFQYWDEAGGGWQVSHGRRTLLVGDAADHTPLRADFAVE